MRAHLALLLMPTVIMGCVAPQIFRSAHPLPVGKDEIGAAAGLEVSSESVPMQLWWRHGVGPGTALAVRAWSFGAALEVDQHLFSAGPVDVAVAPSAGGTLVGVSCWPEVCSEDSFGATMALQSTVPLLVSVRLGTTRLTLAPRVDLVLAQEAFYTTGIEGAGAGLYALPGGSAVLEMPLGPQSTLLLDLTVSDAGPNPTRGPLVYQLGLGIALR